MCPAPERRQASAGDGGAADTQQLARLERENTELKAGLRRELAALRRQLTAAEAALAERDTARAHAAALERRLALFESGQVMVDMGRRVLRLQTAHRDLRQAHQRIWQLEHTLRDAQLEITRIADERDTALAERKALEILVEAGFPAAAAPCARAGSDDCAGCSEAIGPRCVLYVGGRAGLVAQYRQLAGRLGITLIHHNGCLEEPLTHLPDMILGTAVGRACWCVWAGVWREATTRQAHACKAERQSQATAQAYQRACSALTLRVNVDEGTTACAHMAFEVTESGQLPFLG